MSNIRCLGFFIFFIFEMVTIFILKKGDDFCPQQRTYFEWSRLGCMYVNNEFLQVGEPWEIQTVAASSG